MNKRLRRMGKSIRTKTSNHAPEILMGLGIGGMIFASVLTGKATVTAVSIVEEEKKLLEVETLEKVDVVKLTWRHYIPAVLVGGVSVVCLIWGNRVSIKRYTALAAAYSISESAFRDYRHKVVQKIGEVQEKEIHSESTNKVIAANPISNHRVITTGLGTDLCFDVTSQRYFTSDVQKLEKAVNDLNRRMRDEMYISLNEYYWEIDMDPLPDVGENLGWNIDTGYIELNFDSKLTNDNKSCIVVRHLNPPFYEYK